MDKEEYEKKVLKGNSITVMYCAKVDSKKLKEFCE